LFLNISAGFIHESAIWNFIGLKKKGKKIYRFLPFAILKSFNL